MKTSIINPFIRLGGTSRAAWACLGVASREAWVRLGVASTRSRILLPLIAVLNLIPAGRVTAQTFTTLHSFTAYPNYTNLDGGGPNDLVLSGSKLFGTASQGGSSQFGTVFKVNTDGTGFTTLHSFNYDSDGANPQAGLILTGNTLYGTAVSGGSSGQGTVFALNTNGTGFTNLYSFTALVYDPNAGRTNSDGAYPQAGLVLSGSTLYGTAYSGGSAGQGTRFADSTNATGFTNLHSFNSVYGDRSNPRASLIS